MNATIAADSNANDTKAGTVIFTGFTNMILDYGGAAGGITRGMKGATDGGGSPEGSGIFIRHPYIHIPILICLQVPLLRRHRRQCLGARSNIGTTAPTPPAIIRMYPSVEPFCQAGPPHLPPVPPRPF